MRKKTKQNNKNKNKKQQLTYLKSQQINKQTNKTGERLVKVNLVCIKNSKNKKKINNYIYIK